jgi:hypothetical protein
MPKRIRNDGPGKKKIKPEGRKKTPQMRFSFRGTGDGQTAMTALRHTRLGSIQPNPSSNSWLMVVARGQEQTVRDIVVRLEQTISIVVLGGDIRPTPKVGSTDVIVNTARPAIRDHSAAQMAMLQVEFLKDAPTGVVTISLAFVGRYGPRTYGVLEHLLRVGLVGEAFWLFWKEHCLPANDAYAELERMLNVGEVDDLARSYIRDSGVVEGFEIVS